MTAVRGLLSRVQRLEDLRAPHRSFFAKHYGSFEAFEEKIRAEIEAGALDADFPLVHLARWEREGLV